MCCLEIALEGLRRLRSFVGLDSQGRALDHQGWKVDEKGFPIASAADSCRYSDELQYNIIVNPEFSEGTRGWFGEGCKLTVRSFHGSGYCIASGRREGWHGLAQEVRKVLDGDVEYRVEAWVGISGGRSEQAVIRATLKVEKSEGNGYECISIGSVNVKKGQWYPLTGTLRVGGQHKSAALYFDGPGSAFDILVSSVAIVPLSEKVRSAVRLHDESDHTNEENLVLPITYDPLIEVNIVQNPNFDTGPDGLDWWYPMGSSILEVKSGGPTSMGDVVKSSYVHTPAPTLTGSYVYCSNRTADYEGPAQDITDQIQLFGSYQVFAWVACTVPGSDGTTEYQADVALDVDGVWVQGGEILASGAWIEVSGSFRLEVKPTLVSVYLKGPPAGVDVMLAGLQIFRPDRLGRTPYLRQKADGIRKRDVILRLKDVNGALAAPGTKVTIVQRSAAFPLGTCINYDHLEDPVYRAFLVEEFSWAVFENELKWDQVEPLDDVEFWREPDELAKFCDDLSISMRGHCLVWNVGGNLPDWVQALEGRDLVEAVKERVGKVLTRYKGRFKHYDVNNEILHGDFFEEKLGNEFLQELFEYAHSIDPVALLFTNDYDVSTGYDCTSSPGQYVQLIKFLVDGGAPVGGIGVQGHVVVPIGPIITQSFDLLSVTNIPIWMTEIDCSSTDVNVRADDLEVVLREAFAHPNVNGCLLWGFMENLMSRENAWLVNADYTLNAAGERFRALKKEWTTSVDTVVGDNYEIAFRGYHGIYSVVIEGDREIDTFEVTRGDGAFVVDLTF